MSRAFSASKRGAALVVTMITMGILTVIVAGAIVITGKNREVAASRRRGLQIQSCAESARQKLILEMVINNKGKDTVIGNTDAMQPNGDNGEVLQIATGHIGSDATDKAIEELEKPPTGTNSPVFSNVSFPSGSNPVKTYRAVVRCREEPPAVRPANMALVEAEVEFLFQYQPNL